MDWVISSQADAKAPEGSTTRASGLTPEIIRCYEQGMTTREIGSRVGKPNNTIARWLRAAGVKMRKPGQRTVHQLLDDAKFLFDEYWTQNKSAEVIAKELKTTPKTVIEYLRKHGIAVRSTNKGRKFPEVGKRHSEWLKGRYAGDKTRTGAAGK